MSLDTIAIAGVVLVNTVLGLTIFLRNTKSRVNILYAIMVLAVTSWSVANYATNHVGAENLQLLTNRLAFAGGFLIVLSVWVLSAYFPRKADRLSSQVIGASIISPIVLFLCATPFVVASVQYNNELQVTEVTPGDFYLVYIAGILCFFLMIVVNFWQAYRKSVGLARNQIVYLASGILLTFLWILATSAVVPAITGDWSISKLGGLGTVFLIVITGYAIVRHRLFNIQLVIARSLTYAFSLTTIVGIFTLLTVTATSLFFESGPLESLTVQFTYTVLAIVSALTFQPIKRFFDKVTSSVFYRDAYNPQTFLEEFNKVLVSTYDLDALLERSAALIEDTLKPLYCSFDIIGTHRKHQSKAAQTRLAKLYDVFEPFPKKLAAVDELTDEHHELLQLLEQNDIAIVAKLASDTDNERVGLLLLGQRKSGDQYTAQDLRVLEIAANELVIAIQNALRFEEIKHFNQTLQQKVDEATRDLRRANTKLHALDEAKDDFVSMASHQLRTPLTSVKGYLSIVLEEDAGKINESQRKLLTQAYYSSQRMVYLIADLLNVSRLRTGKFVIDNSPVNLAEVVSEEMEQLTKEAANRSLKLTYQKPASFPTLMIDETKIRQLIMNFVDNAIYYTPAGGEITVSLVEKANTVEWKVSDTGIGVPKKEQPHLFTKFYRAGNARQARPDGTGLGLFMAKKVIIAQGGSLIFESREGKGSTFGFSLNKQQAAVPSPTKDAKPSTVK